MATLLISIFGFFFVYFSLVSLRDMDWSNWATKDQMCIAKSEIGNRTDGGDD